MNLSKYLALSLASIPLSHVLKHNVNANRFLSNINSQVIENIFILHGEYQQKMFFFLCGNDHFNIIFQLILHPEMKKLRAQVDVIHNALSCCSNKSFT